MGRKKRKTATSEDDGDDNNTEEVIASTSDESTIVSSTAASYTPGSHAVVTTAFPSAAAAATTTTTKSTSIPVLGAKGTRVALTSAHAVASVSASSSGYAMTSHSGEIVSEDIYVSDGSEDSDIKVVLLNSRNGIMRRGGTIMPKLIQPNRQWTRAADSSTTIDAVAAVGDDGGNEDQSNNENADDRLHENGADGATESNSTIQSTSFANLDPVQRAARLLQEKQRKHELEKILGRQKEAEDNALVDPNLFSRRTAFDVRIDQIEDKAWLRANVNVSDYFNYDFQEEDWLEYCEQQLQIRQELIDAAREERPIDTTIVPVVLSKSRAVSRTDANNSDELNEGNYGNDIVGNEDGAALGDAAVQGPELQLKSEVSTSHDVPDRSQFVDLKVVGGAWGALEGSKLAQLIAEQEEQNNAIDSVVAEMDAVGKDNQNDDEEYDDSNYDESGQHDEKSDDYNISGNGQYKHSEKQDQNELPESDIHNHRSRNSYGDNYRSTHHDSIINYPDTRQHASDSFGAPESAYRGAGRYYDRGDYYGSRRSTTREGAQHQHFANDISPREEYSRGDYYSRPHRSGYHEGYDWNRREGGRR